jgi:hypothetical protein
MREEGGVKRLLGFWICFFVCFGLFAPECSAQVELFAGYSFLRTAPEASPAQNLSGLSMEQTLRIFGDLGFDIDQSGDPAAGAPAYTLLFGPRFEWRRSSRVQPFVHALFGAAWQTVPPGVPGCYASSTCLQPETAFASAFGGGVEVGVTHYLWVRPVQVDYLRPEFGNNPQNDVRISMGLVLRLGNW